MVSAAWRLPVAALLLAVPGVALAADIDLYVPPPVPEKASVIAPPDWVITIGGEIRAVPAWPGAPTNLYALTGVPLFSIRKPADPPFFFGARDGFGFPLLDLGPFQAGPVGTLSYPRYSSAYAQLNGLADVNWGVQMGVYAQYWALPWLRIRGELRQGIGGETGQSGDIYMDAVVPLGQFRLSAGPRLALQTAGAISPYYSINAAQSAISGLPVYNAGGGFYTYGAGAQVEYFWNPQWQTHALFEYERLVGSAADSPLVTMRGSPNQFTVGLGATYTFAMHPLW
jgi:outer membrane protein